MTFFTEEQNKQFRDLIAYLNSSSAYYNKVFKELPLDVSNVQTVKDIEQFPFTTKDDLSKHNDDFLCVPRSKISDYVTTSGTLGDPVTFYLTAKDLKRLARNEMLSLSCAGGSSDDVYQIMTTLDKRFMAGLAYFYGVLELGAGVVRTGPGSLYLQWDSIMRFSPTVLIAIPSFIPKLLEYALQNNIDYKNSGVKSIVCIGEPLRNNDLTLNDLGNRIKSQWDVQLYSTYASTEMSTAFTECEHGMGGHQIPELIILEVLDESDKPVNSGEMGEVVITTLGVEGMPLLRYRTGDLCTVYYEPCKCGRTTPRLGPIVGRKQQMLKFKGTTVFPPAIHNIMASLEEIDDYIIEVSPDAFGNDLITIFLPEELNGKGVLSALKEKFKAGIRVIPHIKFLENRILKNLIFDDKTRKPVKFIDNRNKPQL